MTEPATREDIHKLLCGLVCVFVGLEATDSTDGSPNWWMFAADVERLMSDIESRNFKFSARKE